MGLGDGGVIASEIVNNDHASAASEIDARAVDEFGQTLLHKAAREGDVEQVIRLINKYSAEINARDSDGWTPLLTSCIAGKTDVAIVLLEHGANPSLGDTEGKITPLMVASGNLDVTLVKTLVEHQVELNTESSDQHRTAMHWAAAADAVHAGMKLNIINILLSKHADITTDDFGRKPVDYLRGDDISFVREFETLVEKYSLIGVACNVETI